jgi:hypothetical protein
MQETEADHSREREEAVDQCIGRVNDPTLNGGC